MAKRSHDTFHLNIEFVAGMSTYKATATKSWIASEVALAEKLYSDSPRLKVKWWIKRRTRAGGKTLANMEFKNKVQYRTFMDKYMDNVVGTAKTKGNGTKLPVEGRKRDQIERAVAPPVLGAVAQTVAVAARDGI